MTISEQTDFLSKAFGARETISTDVHARIAAILDSADDEALTAAYVADIKFVSILARIRLIRREFPV